MGKIKNLLCSLKILYSSIHVFIYLSSALIIPCSIFFTSFSLLLPGGNTFAQTPDWTWAKAAGGSNFDWANSVATDNFGNIYSVGWFKSLSITFGSNTLSNVDNTSNTYDVFIAKYDSIGNVLWAKSVGGSSNDFAFAVATSASDNIYMTGIFQSATITFGSTTLTNDTTDGTSDIFIVKYDSSGNVLWAKSAGGNNYDNAFSTTTYASDNVYVTGIFSSSSITFGSTTLTNDTTNGTNDIFIVKYDANGNALWAKSAGENDYDYAYSVATDASENCYVAGYFASSSITFGSTTLTNDTTNGTNDIFIVKYDTNGNVLWAKSAGSSSNDYARSVTIDASGNSYVAGYFASSSIIFGSTTLINDTTNGTNDIFIVKYDANGNALWAKSAGENDYDYAYSVATDASDNCYLAGYFASSSITFGSTTLTNYTTNGTNDIFIVKYDTNGNVLWAKNVGGSSSDGANSIATDALGNCYVVGFFNSSSLTFTSTTLTNVGNSDMYIAKLHSTTTGIESLENNDEVFLSIYPNPSNGNLNIKLPENLYDKLQLIISDINGKLVQKHTVIAGNNNINTETLAPGIYTITITKSDLYLLSKKLIKTL